MLDVLTLGSLCTCIPDTREVVGYVQNGERMTAESGAGDKDDSQVDVEPRGGPRSDYFTRKTTLHVAGGKVVETE